ncbi:MAG: phospho-N-acetylmuramoyl-pentapeptide-transferase [Oscillospiraceae bacterium]|nr:phospho-N-acetylmuramoyl-pentapeptide-transferase [Oscillospiraceae bacterium]MCR5168463.1 phospho-N-acetylmuramoyl-pentapeptide-transferase [Oscillospiraceae bacterium]
MIGQLLGIPFDIDLIFGGAAAGFFATLFVLNRALLTLPKDQGRKYAVNGELSKGKPRGGGVVFVIVFIAAALLFAPLSAELVIIYALTAAAMLTGYLDDMSKIPWGELKKGLLDLAICIIAVVTYCNFDGNYSVYFFGGAALTLPVVIYIPIAVFFLWVSINVTNCTDGVDGLLGSLSTVTLGALAALLFIAHNTVLCGLCLIFCGVLLAYLIYNAPPSMLIMGDAGSRALGLFIGICILKTHIPLIYFLVGLIIFLDGGAGLVKLLVLRIFKLKNFMKDIRTPLHDHFRKKLGWSDTQTDVRYVAVHIMLCALGIYLADIIYRELN